MKKSIFFYKELTPAEVGNTGTHEVYIRFPNNFDYESFFDNSQVENDSVLEVNFSATDVIDGEEQNISLRFVYFKNSNKEKRIPSLGPLFKRHNVQEGDIVCLESRIEDSSVSYFLSFYKKGEIQVNPSAIYFSTFQNEQTKEIHKSPINQPLQQIFYGAPGTGKSHTIKEQTEDEDVIRTTFHPDTDYSTFVGAYKPTTIEVPVMTVIGTKQVPVENAEPEKKIVYEFVSQAFLQAYVEAWKKFANPTEDGIKKQFLVIEEINRGNCAQIFGDLFQLLDRNDAGFSDYPITTDSDMKKQLKSFFTGIEIENPESVNQFYKGRNVVKEVLEGDTLLLPNNLYIWATMNTSDQSLFPIDSAFKRRWDWKYMPISNSGKNWIIETSGKRYDWWQFLEKINEQIGTTTNSEDKKLGYYFCKAKDGVIDSETFVGKVVFYLWNDVFKDFVDEAGDLFQDIDGSILSFSKFYKNSGSKNTEIAEDKVELLLNNLGVEESKDGNVPLEEPEEDEDGNQISSPLTGRDYTKFSINGVGNFAKNNLAAECVKKYIEINPTKTAEEVINDWQSLGNIVPHFIESREQYDARNDNSKRSHEIACGGTVIYVAHDGYGSNGKALVLMDAINQKDWGITIQKVV